MKTISSYVLLGAFLASVSFGQAVTFTGNVVNDFASATILADPGGINDVGLPASLIGALSGWEMIQVALSYDNVSDTLFLGIDCRGICGDADGDGDPNSTGPGLSMSGGVDLPNFSGSESFTFGLDLSGDGVLDVIAGTPFGVDIFGYTVSLFSPFGNLFAPAFFFGTPLPAHTGTVFMTPNAAAPDLEFTITNFSALLNMFVSPMQSSIGVHVFTGSLADDGIGEDFFPANVTLPLPLTFFECFPVLNLYQILNRPTLNLMTGETAFTTRYGLPNDYGCCIFFSLFTQTPGFILDNLGGLPTIDVGLANDLLGSITVIDLGVPGFTAAVACKDQDYIVPPGLPVGTKVYLQTFAYPNAVPFNPALTFYSSNVICYIQP